MCKRLTSAQLFTEPIVWAFALVRLGPGHVISVLTFNKWDGLNYGCVRTRRRLGLPP
jgi:hypothetical protein